MDVHPSTSDPPSTASKVDPQQRRGSTETQTQTTPPHTRGVLTTRQTPWTWPHSLQQRERRNGKQQHGVGRRKTQGAEGREVCTGNGMDGVENIRRNENGGMQSRRQEQSQEVGSSSETETWKKAKA